MSLWSRINRFNAGRWSPLLDGRTDLEDYNAALKTCTGMWPLKYGPAERIRGFEYACDAKVADVRLIPFRFDQSTNYIIETDGTYMRFFDSSQSSAQDSCVKVDIDDVQAFGSPYSYRYGELVKDGGVVYSYDNGFGTSTATNPFDANEWLALTETSTTGIFIYEIPAHISIPSTDEKPHVAQINDVMYMANESYAPFKLSRYGATDWRIEEIDYSYPPTIEQNTSSTTLLPGSYTGSTTMTASADTFQSGHVGSKWEFRVDRDAEHAAFDLTTGGATNSGTIPVFGDWTFTTTGTNWTDTLTLEREVNYSGVWEKVYEVQATGASQENFSITGNENDPSALYRITKGANSSNGIAHLAVGQVEVRGVFEITGYTSATSVNVTWTKPLNFGGTPVASTKWSEAAFSSVQGWPATCCFYQGRLWFGGTSNRKQTLWGSSIDSFENFGTSIPNVLASDSVSYTISSVEQNKIRWILPLNDLIIGTTGTEHSLRGADNNAIEATSAPLIQQESALGSYYHQPVASKDGIVFANQDGSKVYAINYDWRIRGYSTEDITRLNESSVSAKFRSYVKDPYSIYYCGAGAGIFGVVFNRKEEVTAWFDRTAPLIANTGAACSFKDLASTYGSSEDDLWANFAIQNEPLGTGAGGLGVGKTNVICRLSRESSSREIPPYLDAYETKNGATATNLTTPDPDLGAEYTQITEVERFGSFEPLTGTVTINGTTSVVGSGTTFTTELSVGDYIRANSEIRRVESITDNLNLVTSSSFSGSAGGLSADLATGRDDVYAVLNGIVYGPFQVRGDRFSIQAVVSASTDNIIYGLPYDCEIETMKLQAPAGDGMSRNKNKRAINVGIGMDRTIGGEIGIKWEYQDGQSGESCYEIPFRTPQDEMDDPIPFFTGEKLMPLPHGNFRYFSLYYKQTSPLPATITYMSPQILPKGQ